MYVLFKVEKIHILIENKQQVVMCLSWDSDNINKPTFKSHFWHRLLFTLSCPTTRMARIV